MIARLEDVGAWRGGDGADWNATAETFCDSHHIGSSVLVLVRPPAAGAPHARLHLVQDEQHVALVTQPADRCEPARCKRNNPALPFDRLEHHCTRRAVDCLLERAGGGGT